MRAQTQTYSLRVTSYNFIRVNVIISKLRLRYKRKPARNKKLIYSQLVRYWVDVWARKCVRECVMTQDSHVTYEHNTSKTERTFIFSCRQPSRGCNDFPLCPNSKYGASSHIKVTVYTILIRFAAQLEAPKALDTRFRVRILFGSTGKAPRFYFTTG
jgi:hypothetical protein